MSIMSMSQAIRSAFFEEMKRDKNVFIIGEGVAIEGGPFACSKGLLEEFGENRVIDTPISEMGFVGMGVGAALRGMRPIVEIMFNDFLGVCLDQIVNQAAKIRYMTGGQVSVPIVFRLPMGGGRRNAAQHSQCLEALLTHFPGLKVVAPSTPWEAKGLLKTAIRDDDPVAIFEHKLLYAVKGEVLDDEDLTLPLGQAAVKREGKDITLISWSRELIFALEAAEELSKEGIDAEVIDLRSLVPLDWETIKESICKTHHVVIVQEGVKRSGYAAEISAQIMEGLFDELDAPVERVASLNIVAPYTGPLEDLYFPNPQTIADTVRKVLK